VTSVRWTEQAQADLEAIHAYIGRDSPHYAGLTVERLVGAVERLQEFPESGRIVPEYQNRALREVLEGSYRIVYLRLPTEVQVLTVTHGARLLRLPELPPGS
jgi:toxin ParE1/3/4